MHVTIEIDGADSSHQLRAAAALIAALLGEASPKAVAAATVEHKAELVIPAPPADVATADSDAAPQEPAPALAPPAGVAVELDSEGLPWDGRIHATTKTKVAKGSWTKKRGADVDMIKHVEAELRKVLAAPAAIPAPPADLDPAAAFGAGAAAPDTPAPTATAQVAPMAEFARVMREVSARQVAGTLATEMVTAVCVQLGLIGIKDLATRPDLIPAFEALLP